MSELREGFEAKWISDTTELKERHFRGLLKMHLMVVGGIARRWQIPPYLYVDLHAGPGYLRHKGRSYYGSPLIFFELVSQLGGHDYDAMFFEKEPMTVGQLRQSITHLLGSVPCHVFAERCEDAMARWLHDLRPGGRRYGLIYSDPVGQRIPVALLQQAAKVLPRTDILCHVAANSGPYKRGGREYGGQNWLADDIASIDKQYALIREPQGAWQWTFVLLTNWAEIGEWRRAGFYRIDTGRGQDILEQLNLTKGELHARRQPELPFGRTGPMPSTSAIRGSSPSGPRSSNGPAGSASGAASDPPPSPTTWPTRPGERSTSPRTSSPSAIPATAEPTGSNDDA